MTPAPTKPSEALRAARELITPKSAWIQGAMARNAKGDELFDGFEPGACSWCALGSIEHVENTTMIQSISKPFLSNALKKRNVHGGVANFNDGHTHEEILTLFDEAIALAEEAGQ